MMEWYLQRTNNHIALVKKYGIKLGIECEGHDALNLQEPEMTPYVFITWRYKCKDTGEFNVSTTKMEAQNERGYITSRKHNNQHHP